MKALLFLIRRTLKNLIRGIFKKPSLLIGYIFIALFVIFMLVASFALPSGAIRRGSPGMFTGIISLAFVFMYYSTLKIGIEKGSTYFRMADVNMAFTAPIMSNQILLYAFIKQVGSTFLFLFIAICQIPNLKNNFELQSYGIWMVLLAMIMYALSYPLISMILYSWAARYTRRKKMLKRLLDCLALAVVIFFIISLARTRNFGAALEMVFDNPVSRYFPVVGWTASIATAAMTGFTTESLVGLTGMILLIIGTSVALYRLNLDYYEDVLEGAEYIEAAVKAKREGNNVNFNMKIKNKVNQKILGSGAAAVFFRRLLEIRRTAFFLFLDRTSISVILAAIIFKLVIPDDTGILTLSYVLFFSIYVLFLFQVQGGTGKELEKHYIFLIPDSSPKKLFFATLAEHIKNLLDGTVLFVIAGVMFKSSLLIVLICILAYTFFGAVYTYGDVLTRRIFGRIHSKGAQIFIKAIVNLLMILPGVIVGGILVAATESEILLVGCVACWSFILAVTLFVFSSGIFKNLEAAN